MELDGFKTRLSQRCHSPLAISPDHLRASVIVNHVVKQTADETFLAGDRGRRRFDATYSREDLFHPGRRVLTAPESRETEKRGKRFIPPTKKGEELSHPERKHLDPLLPAMPFRRGLPSSDWMRKKIVLDERGIPKSMSESTLLDLEAQMNRKQRVPTTLDRRNFVPEASAGDHSYKSADRLPGFYEQGGLIPGSTNILRASAKPALRKSEEVSAKNQIKPLSATYAKLQHRLRRESELRDVLALTVSGISLKMFTVINF